MAKITLGIKGLRENLGRDDGIVPLFYLWTDYMRPLLPQVSLTKWTKANEKGRHSYQLDQGMDLLERELCESHKKVPYESMIEPEESKADTITHHHHHHHHHHHYHRQHHHHNHFYRAYSLTWPASMLIFTNKRKFLHRKEFNSHRVVLVHQHGRRDVMWIRSIAYKLACLSSASMFTLNFGGKQGILWTE